MDDKTKEVREPLKFVLTAQEHAALSDDAMALYERQSDDAFVLNVVGLDDSAIMRALKGERTGRREDRREAACSADQLAQELLTTREERDRAIASIEQARNLAFTNAVKVATVRYGLHECAGEDCLRAARERFQMSDDGTIKPRDAKGPAFDKWMGSIREHSPHWLPATGSGSGASQSQAPSTSVPAQITRSRYEAMSAERRAAVIASGLPIVDF